MDGRVDVGQKPVDPGEPRVAIGHLAQAVMRSDGDLAFAHRHDIVVQTLQRKAMEIREVAGDVELGDLALATGQVLAARQPPIEDHQALIEIFARANDNFVGTEAPGLGHHPPDCPLFFGANVDTPFSFFKWTVIICALFCSDASMMHLT